MRAVATHTVRVLAIAPLLAGVIAGISPAAAGAARTGSADAASFTASGSLAGVAATSARNAWAVGSTGTAETLIVHWNGTTWKQVPSPNPGTNNFLVGVAVTAARNAWAVGVTNGPGLTGDETLILHWNGTAWKRVPSPSPADGGDLISVAATSARNAWAVGETDGSGLLGTQTLIEHWNGKTWKRVPSPNPDSSAGDGLAAVAATSARNAWAVGGNGTRTLIEHWNGTAWKKARSLRPVFGGLEGVAATSARNAWAVGVTMGAGTVGQQTLILHWNGTIWK